MFVVLRLPATALVLAVLAVSGAHSATASSHFMQGAQLYNLCTSNMSGKGNPLEAGECLGYIVGVSDTYDCVESNHGLHWDPKKAAGSQMKLVTAVLQWLDGNPAEKSQEAHRVVAAALQQSFPCK